MKISDELEQLLKNLRLKRILEIYEEQLPAAEKEDVSYSEFLTRLLRAQWHHRQETALAWRIQQAKLPELWSLASFPFVRSERRCFLLRVPHPLAARAVAPPPGDRFGLAHPAGQVARALVAGQFPFRPPARGQSQTDPHLRRTGVYRQGGEHRVGREHRCRQKRIGVGPAVESFGEWLPLSVHPGTRPVRRDVCLVGRPLHPKTAESAGPPRRSTHRRTGVSQPETGTVQHLLQADGGALPPPLYDHHHQLGL